MKKINLGPGPSFIPENLNESLISSLFDNGERGFSILHQSHRSKEFEDFLNNFRDDIRQFLEVPKNYEVLIMQGGATMLFALLAQNFRFDKRPASYLISGFWSKLAAKNASNIRDICKINTIEDEPISFNFSNSKDWAYFHYVMNETVDGVLINDLFELDCPVICDASSALFGKKININDFDMIYSSSSKHLAVPGFTISILKKDLLAKIKNNIPEIMSFNHWQKSMSIPCTPPTPSIYLCSKILNFLMKNGNLDFYSEQNTSKALLMYSFIDSSNYFLNEVPSKNRSETNFIFNAMNPSIEKSFNNYLNSKYTNFVGHESKGGFRINAYNLFTKDELKSLLDFASGFKA